MSKKQKRSKQYKPKDQLPKHVRRWAYEIMFISGLIGFILVLWVRSLPDPQTDNEMILGAWIMLREIAIVGIPMFTIAVAMMLFERLVIRKQEKGNHEQ